MIYVFKKFIGFISYTDVIFSLLLVLDCICIFNLLFKKNAITIHAENKLIKDDPIKYNSEDLLDYSTHATLLSKEISNLNLCKSWSIGIVAPWGFGKSSFLNLLESELSKIKGQKFIFLRFNPRNSNEVKNIQKDFFIELCNILKPYNSEFNSMFNEYMKALMVLDNKKIIETIRQLINSNSKANSKNNISEALKKLPCKVVIIIEDLDRLLASEIIEVFKLIEGNASFPNSVFITAYDKKQINNVISDKYADELSLFSDKFFNYEFILPIRPYNTIHLYIEKSILDGLKISDENHALFTAPLRANIDILSKYILSIRDAKRFINLFLTDYNELKDEVDFRDYLLISLLKYKNPDIHRKLYKKEYLIDDYNYYIINKNIDKNNKYYDIIQRLFPSERNPNEDNYRRIFSVKSFDIYFINQIYGMLKKEDMKYVLNPENKDFKQRIEKWKNEGKLNDFFEFLDTRNILTFKDKNQLKRFIECSFYISSDIYKIHIYMVILNLLYKSTAQLFVDKYKFDNVEEYLNIVKKIIQDNPQCHSLLSTLIINHCDGEFRENQILFSKEELLNYNKTFFLAHLNKNRNIDESHMSMLYSCIDNLEPDSRKIILDKTCCSMIKEAIIENPNYYINSFVRLGGASSNPKYVPIACEPFWIQIFNSSKSFSHFVYSEKNNAVTNIECVKNFWKIYKHNDFKIIESEGDWNAEIEIKDNLKGLITLLNNIKKVRDRFYTIKKKYQNKEINKKIYLEKCNECLDDLDNIKLGIKLKQRIRVEIENSINEIDK